MQCHQSIGACVIAALIVGMDHLEPGTGQIEDKMDIDEERTIS